MGYLLLWHVERWPNREVDMHCLQANLVPVLLLARIDDIPSQGDRWQPQW